MQKSIIHPISPRDFSDKGEVAGDGGGVEWGVFIGYKDVGGVHLRVLCGFS